MSQYYHVGYFNRKITRWTTSFSIKFFNTLFTSMNYFSMPIAIYFGDDKEIFHSKPLIFLFFVHGVLWLFFTMLVYFEYRRKLTQIWNGLRGFWVVNFLENLFMIFYISLNFKKLEFDHSFPVTLMVSVQASLSIILFYFSIFGSVDYELNVYDNNKDCEISYKVAPERISNTNETITLKTVPKISKNIFFT